MHVRPTPAPAPPALGAEQTHALQSTDEHIFAVLNKPVLTPSLVASCTPTPTPHTHARDPHLLLVVHLADDAAHVEPGRVGQGAVQQHQVGRDAAVGGAAHERQALCARASLQQGEAQMEGVGVTFMIS